MGLDFSISFPSSTNTIVFKLIASLRKDSTKLNLIDPQKQFWIYRTQL